MTGHAEIKQQLAVYDSLGEERQIELNAHLLGCAECAEELSAYRRTDRALRNLPDPWPSSRLQALVREAAVREQSSILPQTFQRARPAAPQQPTQPRPEVVSEPAPETPPDPNHPSPWRRLALPVAMGLLFVGSLWIGIRGDDRPAPSRAVLEPTTAVTDTSETHILPVPPTEAPLTIDALGQVTITFACDDPVGLSEEYQALAKAFESENPDITVQLNTWPQAIDEEQNGAPPGSSGANFARLQELTREADVFSATSDSALIHEGLVRNLAPLTKADATFAVDEFYPAVLQQVTDAGSLYMIPARFRPALIWYNPAAFRAAGRRPPSPGWSWDNLLSAATALTQRDGNNTRRWGFGESDTAFVLSRFLSAIMSPGVSADLAKGDPLADADVLDLFRWFDELYYKARAAPVPRHLTTPGDGPLLSTADEAQIRNGRFAMWTDELGARASGGIRAAPFPVARAFDDTTPVGVVNGWAISSEAQHVDAAWRWISYISQSLPPDRDGMRVPARRAVPQMKAFWSAVAPEDRDAYAYALEHLMPWPDLSQLSGGPGLYASLLSMIRGETSLAALTARGATPTDAPVEASEVVTLTFAAPADQKAAYEQASVNFSAAHPDLRIQVVATEDLLPNRTDTEALWSQMRVLTGRVDALVDWEVPTLVLSGRSQGILYDLTGLISGTLHPADYYPNSLEALQWQGRSWALPGRIGLQLIHYSQWMFVQMGVAYPQPGWTWSDFDRTLRAVALHGGSNSSWWGFKERSINPLQLLKSRAGSLVDYSSNPAKPLLDQPAVVDAATWYAGLLKGNALAPAERAADDSAMWVGLTDPSVLDALQSTGVGVAPFPVGPGSTASTPLELYDAFAISARTRHLDAAWQWLIYLQIHQPAGPSLSGVPARRDGGPMTEKPAGAELQAVVEYALEHTQRPAPLRPEEYMVGRELAAALHRIVQDGQEPAIAMKQAQKAAQKDLGQK